MPVPLTESNPPDFKIIKLYKTHSVLVKRLWGTDPLYNELFNDKNGLWKVQFALKSHERTFYDSVHDVILTFAFCN